MSLPLNSLQASCVGHGREAEDSDEDQASSSGWGLPVCVSVCDCPSVAVMSLGLYSIVSGSWGRDPRGEGSRQREFSLLEGPCFPRETTADGQV